MGLPGSNCKSFGFEPNSVPTTLTHEELDTLVRVSGDSCDFCHKSMTKRFSCARCKMAFYCSKECQRKQWSCGHKKFCRKEDEFQPNDYVRLDGLKSKPELNGNIVTVVKAANVPNRWEVRMGEEVGGKCISVAEGNLRHLRPLDCVKRFQSN